MRFAIASACIAIGGCTVTDPGPLPPPRAPTAAASAAPSSVPRDLDAPTEAPTERSRYWGWIVVADVATLPIALTWMSRSSIAWGIPVVIASPIVHAAHDNPRMAGISLAMRAGLYGATYAVVRSERSSCTQSFCFPFASLLAFDVAAVITSTIDIISAYTDDPIPKWRTLPVLPSVHTTGKDLTLAWVF
ncbi:MAG: hypothetical protein ACXVEF_08970 [Polyangiales bacterium]